MFCKYDSAEEYWKEIRVQPKRADVSILLRKKKKRKQKHPGPWKLSLWLTWVWKLQSHLFPKCGKFRSCREQCELCERAPARVRAFTPGYWWVLRSDGLKSIEKSIIRAPLNIRDCWSHIYSSPVFFFHMRALFLATCYKTQALLQLWPDHHEQRALTFRISRRRSSHHSSHPAGDEVCGMSAAVPCNPGWWPGQNLWNNQTAMWLAKKLCKYFIWNIHRTVTLFFTHGFI